MKDIKKRFRKEIVKELNNLDAGGRNIIEYYTKEIAEHFGYMNVREENEYKELIEYDILQMLKDLNRYLNEKNGEH